MSSDHFSTQSAAYAQFRPTYPAALFDWLVSLVTDRCVAWDCACGSGQATLALAARFERVIATDLSAAQIAQAPQHCCDNVEWRVALAEASGVADQSIDLITVAQALHWFDLPRFWAECHRVLRPQGVLAAWCYGIAEYDSPAVAAICSDFYHHQVGAYWPAERTIVEAGYQTLDFPFSEIASPNFVLEMRWGLPELLGYFSSWSATTRYRQATGLDPLIELRNRLETFFPPESIRVCWPLSLRVGRSPKAVEGLRV